MRLISTRITALVVSLGVGFGACGSDGDPDATRSTTSTLAPTTTTTTAAARATHAEEVAKATEAFLATLDPAQVEAATYPADDPRLRSGWSNLPDVVPRSGINLIGLDEEQRTAAMAIAEAVLSDEGYAEMQRILAADDEISAAAPADLAGSYGSGHYYVAVFGTPTARGAWALQLSGHHLARTLTFDGGTASTTPAFTGVVPLFLGDANSDDPVADDLATLFAMFDGLTDDQRAAADLGTKLDDVLLGPGKDAGAPVAPEGLAVADLDDAQRDRVVDAMRAWVLDVDTAVAEEDLAAYVDALDETYIAFAQSTDPAVPGSYARIHGPRAWIELVTQHSFPFLPSGGAHFHSVYRDLTQDYGA